jgi:tetratricopeptide (TPR) repeat protein
MRKKHLTDLAIIDFLLNPTPDKLTKARRDTAAHFSDCVRCGERFNEYSLLVSTLGVESVWTKGEVSVEPRRDLSRRLAEVIERIQHERTGLDLILANTLTGPANGWKAKIAALGDVYTIGMVEELLARADKLINVTPPDALELTALAVDIAHDVAVGAYAFDFAIATRARACREHAYSLFYAGRFPEALTFVDRAQRLFAQMPRPEFDLARTAVMRALIYRSTDRLPEAIKLTREAADTFDFYGDRGRSVDAKMTGASMLFQQRRYQEAQAIWLPLENEPAARTQRSYGLLLQHLGSCYREMNELERAREFYARAIAEHENNNAPTEKTRVQWSLALTVVASGEQREALPLLRSVWQRFTALGMDAEAALVGLELAEVLLMLDEPDEVPAICRAILDQFTRTGMMSRAVSALSFLREAVAMGKATPSLVRHVHDFIRDLPKNPTRSYTPPPQSA